MDFDDDLIEDALYTVGSDVSIFGDYDDNPHTDTAWVCYVLIALFILCNFFVLPYLVALFPDTVRLAQAATTAPAEATEMYHFSKDVTVQFALYLPPGERAMSWHSVMTAFLSLLVLPSIFQILINAFIVWVFGDNIEYALGRWRFIGFYLLTGLLSLVATTFFAGAAAAPVCAAVGGVSALMGGYARLFPHVRFNVYRRLSTFSLFRTRVRQVSLTFYAGCWLVANILFTWLSTTVDAFGMAVMLPLIGFAIGYMLIPYFRDPDVSLEEPAQQSNPAPRKNFAYYNKAALDPTYDDTNRPKPRSGLSGKIDV